LGITRSKLLYECDTDKFKMLFVHDSMNARIYVAFKSPHPKLDVARSVVVHKKFSVNLKKKLKALIFSSF